jgi:Zn-dependent M28 family amino/carboxypeptidase
MENKMNSYLAWLLTIVCVTLVGCGPKPEQAIPEQDESGASVAAPGTSSESDVPPPNEDGNGAIKTVGGSIVPANVDSKRFLANITRLASDGFGGRAPMSEGEKKTLAFIESAFRKIGLEPLFGDSFLQAVDLVSIEVDPATAQMSFHTDGKDRPVRFEDEMVAATLRVVPESRVESSEVVFVGFGIVAPEYGWNDYADIDVTGKTVLIMVNDPGFATGDPDIFNGRKMTYYGRWPYKYEEAARQGAAAAIIIHDTAPAAYGWDVVRNSWAGPQFHLATANDNMDRVAIRGWLQKPVAEELAKISGRDLAALERSAIVPGFKAVGFGTTMSAAVENTLLRSQSYNIGGLLPGRSNPDELFIYTAHWDHLGTTESNDPEADTIFNGAVDNASGVAGLLELAWSFADIDPAPKRSVAFLAVTAEESGLLGSAWYAANPPISMSQTVGGINMDSMNMYGPTNDVVVVGYGSSEMEDLVINAASGQQRIVKPEEHPERGYFYRSDHFNFAKKGVPMLYAESGSDHRELGPEFFAERAADYQEHRYHAPADEVLDDWDLRGAEEDLEMFFSVGLAVAESEDWPEWYEGNEFRAIRESSLNASQ